MRRSFSHRRILPLSLAGILAGNLTASANDREITGVGGSVRPMPGENPQVQMVDETVTIDVYPTYYDVAATFHFRNHGPATTVTMGFPESGGGGINTEDFRKKTSFLSFRTTVDGQAVTATRRTTALNEGYFQAYWAKPVAFAAGQLRTVQVQYRSKAGHMVLPNVPQGTTGMYVQYPFTGGNWNGLVEHSDLVVTLHLPADYKLHPLSTAMRRQGNRLLFQKSNWQAEQLVNLSFGYEPYTLDQYRLDRSTVQNWDCDMLWQSRNEIFARHGRAFQTPEVRRYFQAKAWYKVNPAFSERMLSTTERANVQVLLAEEQRRGCH